MSTDAVGVGNISFIKLERKRWLPAGTANLLSLPKKIVGTRGVQGFAAFSKIWLLILIPSLQALTVLWLGFLCCFSFFLFFLNFRNILVFPHRGNAPRLSLIPWRGLKSQIRRMRRKSGSLLLANPSSYSIRIHKIIFPQLYLGTGKWTISQKLSWICLGGEKYKANALLWLLTAKCVAAGC